MNLTAPCQFQCSRRGILTKTMLVMKLTAILLVVASLQLSAKTRSQSITLYEKNAPMEKIFTEIRAQSEYSFIYRDEWLKLAKNVDIDLKNATIGQVLEACFKNQPLTYTIIKSAIVIRPLQNNGEAEEDILNTAPAVDISGTVTDADGKPLQGVSVTVKGSTIGTKTNDLGLFTLNGIDEKTVLVFSIVGYQSQEITVHKGEKINISLIKIQDVLDDVVVVGYGSVKKSDLTGAVSSVKQSDIGNVVTSDVGSMIQGRVAGVNVVNTNGVPGAGTKILVRGTGTIYNADPLYIIDGMPGSLAAINTYDIESIEVLKDASSTAIYGARAANGVVLVTTKKGKRGPLKIAVNAYMGIAQTPKRLDMLNASQFIDLAVETDTTFWSKAKRFMPVSEGGLGFSQEWARTTRNNIQDVLFQNALQQEYHVNLSGGAPSVTYSFSVDYQNQDAIVKGYNHQRLNVLGNTEYKYNDILKIGNNFTFSTIEDRGVPFTGYAASLMSALNYAPYMDLYDPSNSWGYSQMTNALDGGSSYNPLPEIYTHHQLSKNSVLQDQIYGEVNLLSGLRFRSQLIYTQSSNFGQLWYPTYAQGGLQYPAQINKGLGWSQSSTWENYFSYNKNFGKHDLAAMAGMSSSSSKFNNSYGLGAQGTSSPSLPWDNYNVLMVSQTPVASVTNESLSHTAYLSYFGRLNYSYLDRYLLTLNYRQDASPNFAPQNRWGRFPSVAVAWKINEEPFLRHSTAIDQLKLRLSWGLSGNDRIPNYGYLSTLFKGYASGGYPNGAGAAFGYPGTWIQGTTSNSLASVDIKWEEGESYNAGLDLSLLHSKFTASLDVYVRNTRNILIQVPINPSSGIDGAPFTNAASVRNKGFDLTVGYNDRISKDLRFSVSGVVGYVTNKVTSLGAGEPIWNAPLETSEFITLTAVGHPIGSFYGYKVDRVLPTTADAEAYNTKYGQHAVAGDIAFQDIAGPKDDKGNPTGPDGKIDDNDRTYIGNPIPKFNYGFNFSLFYKKFDLSIGGTGIAGVQIYDFFSTKIRTTERLKRWRKEGDITDIPRATSGDNNRNGRVSDRFITNGSYLKIRNITLGYNILSRESKYIEQCRVYVTAQNAICFTSYKSYDPELGSMNANGAGNDSNYNLQRGIAGQLNNFPNPRVFLLGVNLTFK